MRWIDLIVIGLLTHGKIMSASTTPYSVEEEGRQEMAPLFQKIIATFPDIKTRQELDLRLIPLSLKPKDLDNLQALFPQLTHIQLKGCDKFHHMSHGTDVATRPCDGIHERDRRAWILTQPSVTFEIDFPPFVLVNGIEEESDPKGDYEDYPDYKKAWKERKTR